MVKWIISDMDGTLLDNDGNLPADFHLVMQELIKRKIRFSPASGRQLGALRRHFDEYSDDMLFIAENGTVVAQKDELLVTAQFDASLVAKITAAVQPLRQSDVYTVCCTPKKSYIASSNTNFHREIEKYFSDYEIVDDFTCIKEPVIKISLCDIAHQNIRQNAYATVKCFEAEAQVVISSDIWLDIMPLGVNKGTAIQRCQKKWQIAPEECMAFGDYHNDKEMLLAVGESYAMADAQPEIKALAKHIAPSNTVGGVTKVIREKVLHI